MQVRLLAVRLYIRMLVRLRPGAYFSKVPKLFGRISGDMIRFVASKVRRLEARNFAVILFLFPLQHIKRRALQNKQVGVLRIAFRARTVFGTFGPESFRDFRETGPSSAIVLFLKTEGRTHRRYITARHLL